MATIKMRENKKGIVFQIKVYDHRLKNSEATMTYKPDENMTLKQARKEAERQAVKFEEKIQQELDTGIGNGFTRKMTFEQLADKWFELQEQLKEMKPSTIERNKGLKTRTYAAIGKVKVVDLSTMQIQDFILSLSKDGVNQTTGGGLSQKTQKHYLTFISDIMNYAVINNIRTFNPCKGVKPTKTQKQEKQVYSCDEVKTILAALNDAPAQYKALFNLLAFTGMRRGEVLGLEWKDIDLRTGVIHIERTSNYRNKATGTYTDTPKTERSVRTVNVPKNVSSILFELYAYQAEEKKNAGDQWHETDRLFTQWDGNPIHPNTPYTWLKRFCEREGITFKGLHSFRHAYATQAIVGAKSDVTTVSSWLGHSQTSTTLNIYTHEIESAKESLANAVASLYSA